MNYDEDFYGWTQANAQALSEKRFNEVDYEHLVGELEAMGKSIYYQLENRLAILIAHLLKWQHQPAYRPLEISGKSWSLTIKEQRERILDLLEDNPSLKSKIPHAVARGYRYALNAVEKETPIKRAALPSACPYTFEQIINDQFYPG